jgi:hypothetical protein
MPNARLLPCVSHSKLTVLIYVVVGFSIVDMLWALHLMLNDCSVNLEFQNKNSLVELAAVNYR